jgi:hypothetical protein
MKNTQNRMIFFQGKIIHILTVNVYALTLELGTEENIYYIEVYDTCLVTYFIPEMLLKKL